MHAADNAAIVRGELTVHADKPLAVINPDVYGQFAEHLGNGIYGGLWVGEDSKIPNLRGFRKDVVGALKKLDVPVVRWPGGCFADQYHWRDGIGPRAKRPVRVNTTWGGVTETNEVGTHEYFELMEQLGSKSYINGNVGTGSPQETKDWLEYLTSDSKSSLALERAKNGRVKPWKIDYFAFGNELWGCGGNMRPDFYADLYHWYAAFAKTPADNTPLWIAAGATDGDTAWNEALMATNKFKDMNAVTMHHFSLPTRSWTGPKGPATGFGEDQWMSIMQQALQIDGMIAAHSAMMDKYDPQKNVGLFVDEWSNWYDVEPGTNPGFLHQQNTLRDAVTAAVNLDIFQSHADRVRMACITQMVNVLQAMILTDGPRMLLTPTYHVYMMYKPFRGASALAIDLKTPDYRFGDAAVPALHASAARRADGTLVISLVDLDPNRPAHVAVSLAGAGAKSVTGTILTADAMDAHNSFDHPNAVEPAVFTGATLQDGVLNVDLPAKSVVVLTLQ
ncbi:MAG TPA: alpha-L-arabinofuranosidase C-terminal domain-containing protein [Rhizomicrobium sp.]